MPFSISRGKIYKTPAYPNSIPSSKSHFLKQEGEKVKWKEQ
ncbi:MAG: hypothetical protein Q7K45_03415 [Nanoarchaeota archaeon]|nr:hypothetical protein [Nanoarchaeota archaeon]